MTNIVAPSRSAWNLIRSLGVCVALCAPAHAETYYVRTSGDDVGHDGLSPATAFATIRRATEMLLGPGDRVIVGAGEYSEGNLQPFGSGSRDQPIVFLADRDGTLTGDPGGVVLINPSRETAFLLYGRHDVVIDGFAIEGAPDAGIQARYSDELGRDSTRITVRNNRIRNCGQRGIHLIAVGDVTVSDNVLVNNALSGISLVAGSEGAIRPAVRDNDVRGGVAGVAVEGANGGTIEDNVIHSLFRGIGIVASRGVMVRANHISETEGEAIATPAAVREDQQSADLTFEENIIVGGGISLQGQVGGTLVVENNQLSSEAIFGAGSIVVAAAPAATVLLHANQAGYVAVSGDADVDIRDHAEATGMEIQGRTVDVSRVEIAGGLVIRSRLATSVSDNHLASLRVDASETLLARNRIDGNATVTALNGVVKDNQLSGDLFASGRDIDAFASGDFSVTENEARWLAIGQRARPLAQALVNDNRAGVFAAARKVEVHGNHAPAAGPFGFIAFLYGADSEVDLSENTVSGSPANGILVVGARKGSLRANEVSDSAGGGIVIRRSADLTIAANTVSTSGNGGITVDIGSAVTGDCDNSGTVTVDEILTGIEIALHGPNADPCPAIDLDGSDGVTVDEILEAVGFSLYGSTQPMIGGGVMLTSNTVTGNTRLGISVFSSGPATIEDNLVTGNEGVGIAALIRGERDAATVEANVVGRNSGEGIFLRRTSGAALRSNVIFSNGESGVLLRDAADVLVGNNLIYDNGNDGISVGVGRTGVLASPNASLLNNTIFGNHGWGITIGTGRDPSLGTAVRNNIIADNVRGGVAAEFNSQAELTVEFNLNNDGYSAGIAPSVTDFEAEPRFVDPAGPDEIVGGEGYADDDFHLRGGDDPLSRSAAIDAGSAPAADFGWLSGAAVAGAPSDEGIVDLGYHYPSAQ